VWLRSPDDQKDEAYVHSKCFASHQREKTKTEIKECLDAAGFAHYSLSAIPNGYSKGTPLTDPWYRVELHWDNKWRHLIIGWRKRVIFLGWHNPEIKAQDIMDGDHKEVTHFGDNCHCWGYEKLTQYLTNLKALL